MNNKPRVLIVDDSPENIDVLVQILEPEYTIQAATCGKVALKICQHHKKPDIILLDIVMEGIDGFEVCVKLKKNHSTRHIPVIFLTAKMETMDEVFGFKVGAVDYIHKPFSAPVVKARLNTHLLLHDKNRELDRLVREQTKEIHETRLKIIQHLGKAAEYKDNETGMHVVRMSYYSKILAMGAGMDETVAELLLNAAPMHDIGKIGIPDHILKKPGRLDAEEWEIMKTHAAIGAKIIGNEDSEVLRMASIVAQTHHEKWDGTGYPDGLKGEEIPFIGRIVAIADVFDALSSKRPYKEPWPIEKIVSLLEVEAGKHFDQKQIPIFIRSMP